MPWMTLGETYSPCCFIASCRSNTLITPAVRRRPTICRQTSQNYALMCTRYTHDYTFKPPTVHFKSVWSVCCIYVVSLANIGFINITYTWHQASLYPHLLFHSHTFMHTHLLTQVSTSALITDADMSIYSLHVL